MINKLLHPLLGLALIGSALFADPITIQLADSVKFPGMLVGQNTNKRVNSQNDYSDPESVKEYRSLSSNTLRYPGGTVSQFFDWETEFTYFNNQKNSGKLAINDFLTLCDLMAGEPNDNARVEPLLVFNLYSCKSESVTVGTEEGRRAVIENAVRWFEYINGPSDETMEVNGQTKHKLNAQVKLWEFGNELTWRRRYPDYNHNDTDKDGIYEGAIVYNEIASEVARRVRARQHEINPDVQLYFIANGASQKNLYEAKDNLKKATSPYVQWNPALKDQTWYQGISEHSYIRAIKDTPEKEIAWAFSANYGYHYYIESFQEQYLGRAVPVWHTEWHDLALPNNQSKLQNKLANAIANVDFALNMTTRPGMNPGLYVHQMWETYAGMVEYKDKGKGSIYRLPAGYAAEGYQTLINYATDRFQETLIGAGTFTGSKQYSVLQIPNLNVKAFRHNNGNVAIGVVNKTGEHQTVQFEPNSPALGSGIQWLLTAPSLESGNDDNTLEVKPIASNTTIKANTPITLPPYSYTLYIIGEGSYPSEFRNNNGLLD
ncbi:MULTISPECIES: hypothetical protein [unclassified Lentimonas]|uniref:hypothetical protein n=1 Tax=unclassified Lentimonas TaxID=2630993 RepID=UPI0013243AF8|nr:MULTISPECIES: hypothetical protein [unclassified Lentimonas]CAA6680181.1 Unannotated [Lentimonas sp. CC4]CAA6687409.1 Unannotated [Lentimonas sp. CC6]CAA7076063.1 Unannotated [Lentimonas sp. CC4]CAA7171978.1 Unannotated [Lentimonas sp. CC21]CAA7181114.1 Unannotated [Lentimonas sp. CC8]